MKALILFMIRLQKMKGFFGSLQVQEGNSCHLVWYDLQSGALTLSQMFCGGT